MLRRLLTLGTLLFSALGAHAQAPDASPRPSAAFAGEWVGAFACDETGDFGVVIVRFGDNDGYQGGLFFVPGPYPGELFPEQVLLAFETLHVQGDTFQAALVRYDEDEWETPLETTLQGTLVADGRVEGILQGPRVNGDTVPTCGQWWASQTAARVAAARP